MFVSVQFVYREGIKARPKREPVVGQMHSDWHKGVRVLYLRPLDWVHNTTPQLPPLATLWQPVFGGVRDCHITVRGLEAVEKGTVRRWTTQMWLCEVLDVAQARERLDPKPRFFEVASCMPPSPPPADPFDPFDSGVN
jgi:hypothetical protein